jgi:NAD(P)-dependent dehydrogenase (short-subunit alcohol dehydrogenase family)
MHMERGIAPWMDKRFLIVGSKGNLGPIWKETIEEEGGQVMTFDIPEWNVRDINSIDQWIWGNMPDSNNIDVVIYNAAIDNPPGTTASFWDVADILDVNLIGAVRMSNRMIPYMQKRGGGTFIFIGSIMGNVGADWRNYPPYWEKPVGYNLSKAALVQLSRSITTQYGRDNIRACTIAFGPYDGGKLKPDFLGKFLKNVPMGRTISRQSLEASLRFAVDCPEFAGQQALIDGGYAAW